MQEKFYEIEINPERFAQIIKEDFGNSYFKLEKGFVGNIPGMDAAGRIFHVIDLVQIDQQTFKEKKRTPLAHFVGEQTNEILAEECQLIVDYSEKLYAVLQTINDQLNANPNAKEELNLENQRKTLLKALLDVMSLDRDGRVSMLKLDRLTKYPKESQYFVEAKKINELPYAIDQDGEEVVICPFSVQFEDENERVIAIDYVVKGANRLIELRGERERLAQK